MSPVTAPKIRVVESRAWAWSLGCNTRGGSVLPQIWLGPHTSRPHEIWRPGHETTLLDGVSSRTVPDQTKRLGVYAKPPLGCVLARARCLILVLGTGPCASEMAAAGLVLMAGCER